MSESTKFLDSKRHRIFKGKEGGYFTMNAAGQRNNEPKATFRKTIAGSSIPVRLNAGTRKNVPIKIRPAKSRIDENSKGNPIRSNKAIINLTVLNKLIRPITNKIPSGPILNLSGNKKSKKTEKRKSKKRKSSGKLPPTVINKLFGLKRL